MGTKEWLDALGKITDILNIGRLIFYPAAGLPLVLSLAMILRTVGVSNQPYWLQFKSDLVTCIANVWVWAGALIAGFIVANIAYARVVSELSPDSTPRDDDDVDFSHIAYRYPQLRTGRRLSRTTEPDFDFAAWLIAEYYRYVEIAIFIPYGVLLSLPLLSVYSLARILIDFQYPAGLDACFFGFALWTSLAALSWTVGGQGYWLPKIATPIYQTYETAKAALIKGMCDYATNPSTEAPPLTNKPADNLKPEEKGTL